MERWAKPPVQCGSVNPSFSSTLLDAIYRSIDETNSRTAREHRNGGPAMQHPFGNHSPSTSSGSMALPQLPRLSELSPAPPNSSYSGVSFNPFVGGHSIDYGDGQDAMDLAPLSASQLGSTLSDYTMPDNNCIDDIDDGFWNMDESWYRRH